MTETAQNHKVKWAVIATGGTGGHVFPAEALASVLHDRDWRILLATDERGTHYTQNFPADAHILLESDTINWRNPLGSLKTSCQIIKAIGEAKKIYKDKRPAVVIGFGGYPSLPALIAARQLRIPTVIHEQNAVLGRVNRWLSAGVTEIATAFPHVQKASKRTLSRRKWVGNPVRPDIAALYGRAYAKPQGTIRLLVTGGSQGARLLSQLVPDSMRLLSDDIRTRLVVTQQTRVEVIEFARDLYHEVGVECEISPFFRNIAGRLENAHIVIGRAGASTVSELAVAAMPSILIPLQGAMDDHQTYNARFLTDAKAAVSLSEKTLSAEILAQTLEDLLKNSMTLPRMSIAAHSLARPNAAEKLADLVEKACGL